MTAIATTNVMGGTPKSTVTTNMISIGIMNNKGGVCKTTVSVNIAVGISRIIKNSRVLLIDTNIEGDATHNIGLDMYNVNSLYCITSGNNTTNDCIVHSDTYPNLWIIGNNPNRDSIKYKNELKNLSRRREMQFVDKLQGLEKFNYVIFDAPPEYGVIHENILEFLKYYNGWVFVPIELEPNAMRAMDVTVDEVKEIGVRVGGIILTKVSKHYKLSQAMEAQLTKFVGGKILRNYIKRSVKVSEYEWNCTPIIDTSHICGEQFIQLTHEILREVHNVKEKVRR